MDQIIKVLVVDDSAFMRSALVRMIEKNPRFKVVDTASNGREGVDKALRIRPDVVTMDVEMPVMNGIEALREIMQKHPMPVVMVSTLTESGAATTMQALELGAVDFIPKSLQDQDKNIFRGAEMIHEKLLAAASARVRSAGPAAAVPPSVAPAAGAENAAPVPTSQIARFSARIVVVGSSTGGPRALQDLLRPLPESFPLPIVVAQHMPANFTQALAQRLDETCAMRVVEATAGSKPQPGYVYIAPGGTHLRVGADGGFTVQEDRGESLYRPSVDVLAESVSQLYHQNVLGVMLTGMGNDGTRAFGLLKKQGAHLIAQDAASCVVYGMPKAVVEAGAASEVLSLANIGPRLCRLLGLNA